MILQDFTLKCDLITKTSYDFLYIKFGTYMTSYDIK